MSPSGLSPENCALDPAIDPIAPRFWDNQVEVSVVQNTPVEVHAFLEKPAEAPGNRWPAIRQVDDPGQDPQDSLQFAGSSPAGGTRVESGGSSTIASPLNRNRTTMGKNQFRPSLHPAA